MAEVAAAEARVARHTAWHAARKFSMVLLALLSIAAASCSPAKIDDSRAAQIARDFVVQGQPSDVVIVSLTNDPPTLVGEDWQVRVDSTIRIPSGGQAQLHYIIKVSRSDGTATIVAQG